ncbi:MAG: DUF2892 domain-containing protein [archaeon]
MTKNIGKTDKIVRWVIAIIAAYFGYVASPWFYIITAVAIITALTSWCGLYDLLGVNTIKSVKKAKRRK